MSNDYTNFKEQQLEIKKLLNSEGGKRLREGLKNMWNPDRILGETPQETAYNVGKRDAYMDIETLAGD